MYIWLIGKYGLIASAIRRELERQKIKFISTSKEQVDITDNEQIKHFVSDQAFSHIINCAAYTSVDQAEKDISLARLLNATSVEYLADICEVKNIKLVHISTDFVFDGTNNKPYIESDIANPINIYGKTKLEGETYAKQVLHHLIIRTAWVFGTDGENFLSKMAKLLQSQKQIMVANDQIGSPTFAEDFATALLHGLDFEGTLHICNDGQVSRYEWVKALKKNLSQYMDISADIIPTSSKAFKTLAMRPKYSALSTKMYADISNAALPHWEDSLNRYTKELIC